MIKNDNRNDYNISLCNNDNGNKEIKIIKITLW